MPQRKPVVHATTRAKEPPVRLPVFKFSPAALALMPKSEFLTNPKRHRGVVALDDDEKRQGPSMDHPLARMRSLGPIAMSFAGYTPLPNRLETKLKYAEHVLITGTSGALGLYVFNASSLYDPNYTGTGHQPRGFDQIMPLYDHFVVLNSEIRVQFVNQTANVTTMAGLALSSTVTNQGDWDDYAEGPRSAVMSCGAIATSGMLPPYEARMKYSATKFLGIPDPVTADKLQGTISANPVDNAFYHLIFQDAAETTTVSVRCLVEIEYHVVFIEPLNPSQS